MIVTMKKAGETRPSDFYGMLLGGWLRLGCMFRRRTEQLGAVVLEQAQVALILAQHIGTDLVAGQVLDVITGPAIGEIGLCLIEPNIQVATVSRRQRIKCRCAAPI